VSLKNAWAPAAIVLLALVLRVFAVGADSGYRPANDAFEYDYAARSIAAGDGYPRSGYLLQGGPTAIRGPGYPYLLGATYALAGNSRTAGRMLNALLGAVAVLLLYLIARRLWGRRIGLLAAVMAAIFPPLVLLGRDLVSESLFIALELGAVLCVLNFRRSGGGKAWALAAGALCGLAVLTRNTGVVLILPVAVGLWTPTPRLRPAAVLAPALAVAAAILVIAPWLVRDAVQFGRFVPVTTSAGIGAAGTYNEDSFRDGDSHGAWRDPQLVPQFRPLFVTPGIDEAEVDAKLRGDAESFAWNHPGYLAETSAWNLLRLFELVGGSVVGGHGQILTDRGIGSADPPAERVGLGLAALLAIAGVAAIGRARTRSWRQGGPPRVPSGPLFFWMVPALMLLIALPIAGLPRYRLPADPFLLVLAAVGAASLWDHLGRAGKVPR
jgi:4-amino-4-deoxy-L-arabinose transferase-like glycosyltransferase